MVFKKKNKQEKQPKKTNAGKGRRLEHFVWSIQTYACFESKAMFILSPPPPPPKEENIQDLDIVQKLYDRYIIGIEEEEEEEVVLPSPTNHPSFPVKKRGRHASSFAPTTISTRREPKVFDEWYYGAMV
jgi:hypothetical protein